MKKYFIMGLLLSIGSGAFATPTLTDALTASNPYLLSQFIQGHSMLLYLSVFFVLGLLLSFTPCVLPMVPILSGIIINRNPNKSFRLSIAYVLGMAITYAIIGVLAAFMGRSLTVLMQNQWVIYAFASIFVLLGLNLLGFFEIRLPQINRLSINQQRVNFPYLETFIMGVLSTLVVSPCVTAPLIGVLTFISQTQEMLLGGVILFTLALGMGVPLLLIGAGQKRLLPKTGPWMDSIKMVFGLMMLLFAVYLLSRVIPREITQIALAGVLAFSGLLIVFRNKRHQPVIFGMAASILIGSGYLIYQPLNAKSQTTETNKVAFESSMNLAELNKKLALAKLQHKKVFLEFYASWCSDCTAMDKTVFNQTRIHDALGPFTTIRIDISQDTPAAKEFKKHFSIYGTPSMLFISSKGEELSKLRAVGYINQEQLLSLLKQVH